MILNDTRRSSARRGSTRVRAPTVASANSRTARRNSETGRPCAVSRRLHRRRRRLVGWCRRPCHCQWLCPSRHPRATRSGRRCRKRRRRGRCRSCSNISHLSSRPSRDIRRCRWACSTSSRCGFRAARRLCLRVRPRRCRRRRASCSSSSCSRLARARCRARYQAHRPHRAQDHCPAHCQARSPRRAAQRPPVARRGPLLSLRRASHLATSSHASR